MISLYSGTPGSGKSLNAARTIIQWCKRGRGVIANFPVTMKGIKRVKSAPVYLDNSELTVQHLKEYALEHHVMGKEGQTLVVIDECQVKFNSREFGKKDRQEWVNFFSMHRKYGFDFLLIAQYDRMIDRQIRCLIENEYKHRKLNNYGFGGFVLSLLTLNRSWFIAIEYWYGGNKLKLSEDIFPYRKSYGSIYNTFALFEEGAPADGLVLQKAPPEHRRRSLIKRKKPEKSPEELENERFWARLAEVTQSP